MVGSDYTFVYLLVSKFIPSFTQFIEFNPNQLKTLKGHILCKGAGPNPELHRLPSFSCPSEIIGNNGNIFPICSDTRIKAVFIIINFSFKDARDSKEYNFVTFLSNNEAMSNSFRILFD